jgi:hypothetical protein
MVPKLTVIKDELSKVITSPKFYSQKNLNSNPNLTAIYLISAKSSSPELRMICFLSAEMLVGPSSDLVNLSEGN